jgi:adenylate kinase family enzyme
VMLGTPGVGKGTFASYDEICSENLGPVQADIVYGHATKLGEVIEQRIELLHDG